MKLKWLNAACGVSLNRMCFVRWINIVNTTSTNTGSYTIGHQSQPGALYLPDWETEYRSQKCYVETFALFCLKTPTLGNVELWNNLTIIEINRKRCFQMLDFNVFLISINLWLMLKCISRRPFLSSYRMRVKLIGSLCSVNNCGSRRKLDILLSNSVRTDKLTEFLEKWNNAF